MDPCIDQSMEDHDDISDDLPFEVVSWGKGEIDILVATDEVAEDRHEGASDEPCDYGVEFVLVGVNEADCKEWDWCC